MLAAPYKPYDPICADIIEFLLEWPAPLPLIIACPAFDKLFLFG